MRGLVFGLIFLVALGCGSGLGDGKATDAQPITPESGPGPIEAPGPTPIEPTPTHTPDPICSDIYADTIDALLAGCIDCEDPSQGCGGILCGIDPPSPDRDDGCYLVKSPESVPCGDGCPNQASMACMIEFSENPNEIGPECEASGVEFCCWGICMDGRASGPQAFTCPRVRGYLPPDTEPEPVEPRLSCDDFDGCTYEGRPYINQTSAVSCQCGVCFGGDPSIGIIDCEQYEPPDPAWECCFSPRSEYRFPNPAMADVPFDEEVDNQDDWFVDGVVCSFGGGYPTYHYDLFVDGSRIPPADSWPLCEPLLRELSPAYSPE